MTRAHSWAVSSLVLLCLFGGGCTDSPTPTTEEVSTLPAETGPVEVISGENRTHGSCDPFKGSMEREAAFDIASVRRMAESAGYQVGNASDKRIVLSSVDPSTPYYIGVKKMMDGYSLNASFFSEPDRPARLYLSTVGCMGSDLTTDEAEGRFRAWFVEVGLDPTWVDAVTLSRAFVPDAHIN